MADKSYLVDASNQGAYDTSYTPSPYDGSIDQGAPPSNNLDNSTHGQGMFSNGPATMPSTGAYVVSSVETNTMYRGGEMPPNYILQNILVIIFCSLIFGIIGLIKGSMVSNLYLSGNSSAAEAASLEARRWSRIGILVGCFVKAFLIGFFIIYSV